MKYVLNAVTGDLQALATAVDVGNTQALWNANQLQGKSVPVGTPGSSHALVYNAQTGAYENKSIYSATSVLDFIPVLEHLAIFNRTSTLDLSSYINTAIAQIASKGGTLSFPDGLYQIASPIILLKKVSMQGACITATIKALSSFNYTGTAFPKKALIKTDLGDTSGYIENIRVENFTLDGNNIADYGLEVIRGRFNTVCDLNVYACVQGGIFTGSSTVSTTYEIKFRDIWIWRTDVLAATTTIGFCLNNTTDCYPSQIIVIGYYTSFKSFNNSGGNHFVQCHGWNRPVNGSLKQVFWCGGPNDTYDLCYADTPVDGANEAYGFYVDAPNQKIVNSFVFNSAQPGYGSDNLIYGIFCSANSSAAAGCIFIGNNFAGGGTSARIKQDIGGQYFLAEVFANTSNSNVSFAITARVKKGILFSSGGNTSTELTIRDTGASFLDNIVSLSPYPSGNGGTSTTVPGSTNRALIALFNQTSTTGEAAVDIYDAAAVIDANGQRFTTNVAHRLSCNGVSPSYLGMTNNIGFGKRLPGAKVDINGGLIVTNLSTAVGDPGAGNIRTLGMCFGYATVTASRTQFTTDFYITIDATTGNITYTLLSASTQVPGKTIFLKRGDNVTANTVTITAQTGQTIEGVLSRTLTAQYASIRLYTNGSNIWFIG